MHTLTVADIMSTDVVTVDGSMTLREVAAVLSDQHLSGAPVVDARRVVGVISASDVLRYAAASTPAAVGGEMEVDDDARLDEWDDNERPPAEFYTKLELEEGAELAEARALHEVLESTTAAEMMTPTLCSLPPDASVIEASNYMLWAEVHRILVIEHEELVGIVTTMDIVRAVAQKKL